MASDDVEPGAVERRATVECSCGERITLIYQDPPGSLPDCPQCFAFDELVASTAEA